MARRDCCDLNWKDFLVRTNCNPKDACTFELNKECEELFDIWNEEHTEVAGTDIDYWIQDLVKTKRDPLYNEPTERIWAGPFRFKALVKLPQNEYEAREEGARELWTGQIFIPRLAIENSNMEQWPKIGDVIRIWSLPFYDQDAMGVDQNIPNAGLYFDVIQTQGEGHPLDNPSFTRFQLDVKRRTEFTPERRLLNQT